MGNESVSTTIPSDSERTTFSDIKSLIKGPVLIANVLPVFSGFWLALYFSGALITEQWPLFILTMLGSTLVMAGALVINNWYDVDIDEVMARTQNRPTVTGKIPLKIVLWTGIGLSLAGFVLLWFTTWEATLYAFIGWFTYVVLYTMWTKRKYTLNTVIGSISGAVSPLIGWAAIESAFHIVPIMLLAILFIFQMPHTFAIAIKKYEEYKAADVAMLPVVHGFSITKRQIVIYIACLLPLPFYLIQLGTFFITVATILNVGWLIIALRGLFMKDDQKWAHWIFLYSVNYITIIFVLAVLVTLPAFQ